jgi:hypothetical protein
MSFPLPEDEMTEQDLELVEALHTMCCALVGKLDAIQTTQDSIVGALVRTFPPMLEPIERNLRGLAAAMEGSVQPESLAAFRNQIAAIQQGLATLR